MVWPRFPQAVRSQIIGYIWDTTAPVGSVFKSQKNGHGDLLRDALGAGRPRQVAHRAPRRPRGLQADLRRGPPEDPGGLAIGIDSDDVKGTAESYIGRIVFRKP